ALVRCDERCFWTCSFAPVFEDRLDRIIEGRRKEPGRRRAWSNCAERPGHSRDSPRYGASRRRGVADSKLYETSINRSRIQRAEPADDESVSRGDGSPG